MKHSYLYEIWLDDEDIISAKRMGSSGETQEEVAYSNFMEYIRDNRDEDSIELLIRKINKDQVIAIREFNSLRSGEYGTYKVSTVYTATKYIPTFTCDLYINGDGYLRKLVNSKYVRQSHDYTQELLDTEGMHGCYTYFTIEEASYTCCARTFNVIIDEMEKQGLNYKTSKTLTIAELFKTDKLMLCI